MDVHIVRRKDDPGHSVLTRIANSLAEAGGWTISPYPRPSADANYFLPYIEWAERFRGGHETLTAAWFTHYEVTSAQKTGWWHDAAKGVDLRLTCVPEYADMLAKDGPTAMFAPPVDLEHFTIAPERRQHGLVGVSGYVARGARKGEHLVGMLVNDWGKALNIQASGYGWPVRNQRDRAWAEMPAFYQSLEIYLCTSVIEGVPMPPLEALACGTKVVIPRGVGMLDLLPNVPGVFRYERGDYQSMTDALIRALNFSDWDSAALREVAAQFTVERGVADHVRAFETLLERAA